jgi:hypothetical protein
VKSKEVLGRVAEVATFLFAMFGGFLEKVAPPEEANASFALGLGSFMTLVVLLAISVLARRRFSARRRSVWIAVAGVLAVVALAAGLLYQRQLGRLTFFYPPQGAEAERLVRGTRYTPSAQRLADQGVEPGRILASFGPENFSRVWPQEAVEDAKTILTVNYLLLVLSLAGAVFALVEVYLAAQAAEPASRKAAASSRRTRPPERTS